MRCRAVLIASCCLSMVLMPRPASAQATDVPRGDVFAGVAVWHEDYGQFNGFQLTGSFRPVRAVSFIGDLTTYSHRNTFMGGARVHLAAGRRVEPFIQIMMGSAPLDDIALQPGGGVDIRVSRNLAVRLAGDLKFSGDDGNTYFGTRMSAGVVLRFGHR